MVAGIGSYFQFVLFFFFGPCNYHFNELCYFDGDQQGKQWRRGPRMGSIRCCRCGCGGSLAGRAPGRIRAPTASCLLLTVASFLLRNKISERVPSTPSGKLHVASCNLKIAVRATSGGQATQSNVIRMCTK